MRQRGTLANETTVTDIPRDRSRSVHERSSHILDDLKVTGDIATPGDLHINGTLEGRIECRAVTVGESAQINGSIDAYQVRVYGSVTGDTTAVSVHLEQTARVVGNIVHESLSVVPGAYVDGHCRRAPESEATAKTRVAGVDDCDGSEID